MQTTITFFLILLGFFPWAWANQPSSVPGVSVKNFHLLLKDEGAVYRGGEPTALKKQIQELQNLGINEVIIFKEDNKAARVPKEIEAWKETGLPNSKIHFYPMTWKPSEVSAKQLCEYTIESLKLIRRALNNSDTKLFFHCSAGEDRTGLLAGLTRVLKQKWTPTKAFQEMCAFGYERGHGGKPPHVRAQIRETLTTLFLDLVDLHKSGDLQWATLDPKICASVGRTKTNSQKISQFTCRD